jgi:hypothetical protein
VRTKVLTEARMRANRGLSDAAACCCINLANFARSALPDRIAFSRYLTGVLSYNILKGAG